ncbi:MAG: hypothetical protein ACK4EY_12440 [Flavipsychrobacter sp.]
MQEETKSKTEDFKIAGNWEHSSKQLMKNHPTLTEQDVKLESGKENELLSRVEKKLNMKREEVISLIQDVQSKH